VRPVVLLLLLSLFSAVAEGAEPHGTPARALLMLADSPPELRTRLLACADSAAAAGNRQLAGEALGYAGTSFRREGRVDSAIVCYRRAVELDGGEDQLAALLDQLLLRNGPGDADEVVERLAAAVLRGEIVPGPAMIARRAWARFQQGMPDSASALFDAARQLSAAIGVDLAPGPTWRYRMGRVALELEQLQAAVNLLLPVAAQARGTDEEVNQMLEQAGNPLGMTRRFQDEVARRVLNRDRSEVALATALGGRLFSLSASDGFRPGGLLVPAPRTSSRRTARRPLLAIVLMPPGDTLATADSLALALRRHGLTTLLLQLRGHGLSVGSSCPLPDAWFDREAMLEARVARDVRDALSAVNRNTPVDTARYIVVGAGPTAPIAVEAALLDPRVKALLLVNPEPAPVERGLMRSRLARLHRPVFFQIDPERTAPSHWITEDFYRAGDAAASRVVETRMGGVYLAQFQNDPDLAPRFLAWLDATLRPTAPRSTRPGPRR